MSVTIQQISSGSPTSKFSLAYPPQLNGIITPEEYKTTIERINHGLNDSQYHISRYLRGLAIILLFGGFIICMILMIRSSNTTVNPLPIILTMIFGFIIILLTQLYHRYCVKQLQQNIARIIDEENLIYGNRQRINPSRIVPNWREVLRVRASNTSTVVSRQISALDLIIEYTPVVQLSMPVAVQYVGYQSSSQPQIQYQQPQQFIHQPQQVQYQHQQSQNMNYQPVQYQPVAQQVQYQPQSSAPPAYSPPHQIQASAPPAYAPEAADGNRFDNSKTNNMNEPLLKSSH